jgi:hypothetical protein
MRTYQVQVTRAGVTENIGHPSSDPFATRRLALSTHRRRSRAGWRVVILRDGVELPGGKNALDTLVYLSWLKTMDEIPVDMAAQGE